MQIERSSRGSSVILTTFTSSCFFVFSFHSVSLHPGKTVRPIAGSIFAAYRQQMIELRNLKYSNIWDYEYH